MVDLPAMQEMIQLIREELHLIEGGAFRNIHHRIRHIALIRHDKEDRPTAIKRKETDIVEFLLLSRRSRDGERMRQHRDGFRHVPEDFFLTVHMIHQHVVDHVLLFRRNRSGLHQPVHIKTVSFDRRDATRGGMRLLKVALIL